MKRLRISGTIGSPVVTDADTGDVLEGVKEVSVRYMGSSMAAVVIELDRAAIDVTVPAGKVTASGHEDGKYAHVPLLDVAGLRWIGRRS